MRRTLPAGILLLVMAAWLAWAGPRDGAKEAPQAPDGWTTAAPRKEIAPDFSYVPGGGPGGR